MKKYIPAIIFAFFAAVMFSVYGVHAEKSDIEKARCFLRHYGWETDTVPCETEPITVPETFDAVFSGYDELQSKAGLSLKPYRGNSGMRYTFVVKNYPLDVGETVYANVIIINSAVCGGDIMTRSLSGFMHSLADSPA